MAARVAESEASLTASEAMSLETAGEVAHQVEAELMVQYLC